MSLRKDAERGYLLTLTFRDDFSNLMFIPLLAVFLLVSYSIALCS